MRTVLVILGIILVMAGLAVAFQPQTLSAPPCNGGVQYQLHVVGQVRQIGTSGGNLAGVTVYLRLHSTTGTVYGSGISGSNGVYEFTATITSYNDVFYLVPTKVDYEPVATYTYTSGCYLAPPPTQQLIMDMQMAYLGPLEAEYSYKATNLDVVFTQLTTGLDTSVVFLWAFGDGTTSTTFSPSHTYGMAGTYAAKLTVTRMSDGRVSETSQSITVSANIQSEGATTTSTQSQLPPGQETPTPGGDGGGLGGGSLAFGILSLVLILLGAVLLITGVAWRGGA